MRFGSINSPLCDLRACFSVSLSNTEYKMRVIGRMKWANMARTWPVRDTCNSSIYTISEELPALSRSQDAVLVKIGEKDRSIQPQSLGKWTSKWHPTSNWNGHDSVTSSISITLKVIKTQLFESSLDAPPLPQNLSGLRHWWFLYSLTFLNLTLNAINNFIFFGKQAYNDLAQPQLRWWIIRFSKCFMKNIRCKWTKCASGFEVVIFRL